jgi:hypothetical protein
VEQLLAFKPGDFIELDLDPMIQAKVDGVPVFDCHYGTSNNRYSIKIDKLLERPGGLDRRTRPWPLKTHCPCPKRTRWPPNGPPRWPRASLGRSGNEVASEVAGPAETVAPATFTNFSPTGANRAPATT